MFAVTGGSKVSSKLKLNVTKKLRNPTEAMTSLQFELKWNRTDNAAFFPRSYQRNDVPSV